jgi:hypothetical protein
LDQSTVYNYESQLMFFLFALKLTFGMQNDYQIKKRKRKSTYILIKLSLNCQYFFKTINCINIPRQTNKNCQYFSKTKNNEYIYI